MRAGIMGKEESHYVATQGAGDLGCLLDQLLAGVDAATALDMGGLLDSLEKGLSERALGAEMDHHLEHDEQAGNNSNGYGRKTVVTDTGKIEVEVPRDRAGSFDPQLIAKYQRRASCTASTSRPI